MKTPFWFFFKELLINANKESYIEFLNFPRWGFCFLLPSILGGMSIKTSLNG